MYTYLWVFEVGSDHEAEFLHHYGPNGTWAQLFRRADGYEGTILCRDRERPSRFVTIDTWRSADAYDRFRGTFAREYADLDRRCETLTDDERSLGSFEHVGAES
jgi:quinol monooxygenase YgiN